MNNSLTTTTKASSIEAALIQNDLSKLSPEERVSYYKSVCDSVGLNPLTQPFAYITLNGKLTLYAKRDATDQLRKIHKVSITISGREQIGDVYVVTAKAKDTSGREDESTGAVAVTNLKGEVLANAFMKAETKAKRRVTLSVCGLGLLDETEVDSISDAKHFHEPDKEIPQVMTSPTPQAPPKKELPNYAPASRARLNDLIRIAKQRGWKNEEVAEAILQIFKVKSSTQMREDQVKELIDIIQNMSFQAAMKEFMSFDVDPMTDYDAPPLGEEYAPHP